MKVLVFGTAILACAIPAFSQVNAPVPGGCEAALVTPGVPSAIIVVPVPTPAPYAGVAGSAHSLRTPGMTAGYPGSSNHSSSTACGVIWGSGTVSGIGAMGTSGIGTMKLVRKFQVLAIVNIYCSKLKLKIIFIIPE